MEFARRFTKGNHAFIVCTHIDRRHIHNHIIWNSTTLDCTRKFRDFHGSGRAVRRLSDTICIENGYSVIEDAKGRGKTYNKWPGNAKKPCHRDDLRAAIDRALEKEPADLDALFDLLHKDGIQVSRRGKSVNLKAPGWAKAARLSSLGSDYSEDDLLAVLVGKKKHTPRARNPMQADTTKMDLLVDIQAKLAEGKGAGYARWAASFNLKQMANTLNYEVYISTSDRFHDFQYNGVAYHRIAPKSSMDIVDSGGVRATSLEQTVVDSIADFEKIAGLEETLRCILLIPALDEDRMIRILEGRANGYLWQKCGYILEQLNDGLGLSPDFFDCCHDHIAGSKRALMKDTSFSLVWNKKWDLYVPQSLQEFIGKGVNTDEAI